MRRFRLFEREVAPGCREVQVEGELDLAVADQLRAMLERFDDQTGQVLIGLEKCEFIDSTGIAVIVNAHQQLAEQGGRIAIYAPNDQILRVLSVTGLTSKGMIFESFDEALAESGPEPSLEQG
jgi:anti-sigma B factor antagonist